MRYALAFLFSTAAFADSISWGVRGGAPILDAFNAAESRFKQVPHHFVFGPTFELRFPLGIGVSVDALYSKLEYQPVAGPNRQAGHWEFPILGRYRFGVGPVRPFVAGGPSFNRITGLALKDPQEFVKSSTTGVILGGGIELNAIKIHIAPEIRYTHRLDDNFSLQEIFKSRRNQITVLVGVTF